MLSVVLVMLQRDIKVRVSYRFREVDAGLFYSIAVSQLHRDIMLARSSGRKRVLVYGILREVHLR